MIDSRQTRRWARFGSKLAPAVFVFAFLPCSYARESGDPVAAPSGSVNHVSERPPKVVTSRYFRATDIGAEYWAKRGARIAMQLKGSMFLTRLDSRSAVGANWQQPPSGRSQRSTKRKVLGAVLGGVGGFFGGGFLGAKIEGNRCNCDDPGLVGFMVGAPIGGVAGSILGYKFFF